MATVISPDDFNPTWCKTQDGTMGTFGYLPQAAPRESPHGSHPGEHTIMVGIKEMIPRWDIHTSSPCVLQYYLQTNTFDVQANADLAKTLLEQAAGIWNSVGCGVTFAATTDPLKAHFDVIYDKGGDPGDIAEAFFPNKVGQVHLYPLAFSNPDIKKQLVNTITHELGHVLGLRHEFADQEGNAIQLGSKNDASIMTYNRSKRAVQQSDRDGLKQFYALQNGLRINSVAITDFPPQYLKRQ